MKFVYSEHWKRKRKYRPDITDEKIEYAIQNSTELRDKYWSDTLNAISRIPPTGRMLKVAYKKLESNNIKIITAFWLD